MPEIASGSDAQVLIQPETTFGETPGSVAAGRMPFISTSLASQQTLIESAVIQANRNAKQPSLGNIQVPGNIVVAVDEIAFGYWLAQVLGQPTTTWAEAKNLDAAAAVDKGSGKVGIPVTGHGYATGEPVTIAGTTNYDGSYAVDSTSTTNEVVIVATYVAETFGGTETIRTDLRSHVFKPSTLPSYVIDVGHTGLTTPQYFLFNGVKAASLALATEMNDQEFQATVEMMGAKETMGASALDASPATYSFYPFAHVQASLEEGGSAMADGLAVNVNIANDLEDFFLLGGGGTRGAIVDNKVAVTGSLKGLFNATTAALLTKALAGTESSLKLTWTNPNRLTRYLELYLPELMYERKSPGVPGPRGVVLEQNFRAYYEDSSQAASVQATLVNTHADYTAMS